MKKEEKKQGFGDISLMAMAKKKKTETDYKKMSEK